MRRALIGAFAAQLVFYVLLSQSSSYWQAALCYMASGTAQGVVWVFAGTLLQASADQRFHGRVFAIEFGTMTLLLALSSLGAGAFVDAGIGPREVVAMLSPLPLIGVLVAFYVWRAER
jgi:hypothetical protein